METVKVSVWTVPKGQGYVYASTNLGLGFVAIDEYASNPYSSEDSQMVYMGPANIEESQPADGSMFHDYRGRIAVLPDGTRAYYD